MEETQPKHLILETEVVQATINYLQTRPWAEVNVLISALAQAKIANVLESEETADKKQPKEKGKE